MTIAGQKLTVDDSDIQIGLAQAHGLSLQKIADLIGIHKNTVHGRTKTHEVKRVEAAARTILAQVKTALLEDVADATKKRMRALFDRSFTLSETLLEKAEQAEKAMAAKGDAATLEELRGSISMLFEVHKHITVWSAKHTIAPLPSEVRVESQHVHTHEHVFTLSLDDAANMIESRKLIKPPALQLGEIPSEAVDDGG